MALSEAFSLAGQQIGLSEREQNAALQEYMQNGGVNLDPATTAWCAAFVNATLGQAGMQGTGSNMARSFLDWGMETQQPQRGDLAIFTRGDPNGPYGHVGFFDGYNEDGTIRVLGGNQGDSVSLANYSPDSLLGFRTAGEGGQRAPAGVAGMFPGMPPIPGASGGAGESLLGFGDAIGKRLSGGGTAPSTTPKPMQRAEADQKRKTALADLIQF